MNKASYPFECRAFDDGHRDARRNRAYAPKWKAKWLRLKYQEGWIAAGRELPEKERLQ